MARSIELSELEVRHIAETCRETIREIESMRAFVSSSALDMLEEDLRETLRILREEDHDEA